MSVRVMTLVWEMDLPDSEKLVLLALADCANDEGHCWPSMATLARKCSKSDRTVQLAVKMLCAKGHLTRREVPGKGCNYTVHPIVRITTPEATAPRSDNAPKGTTLTPEAASDKPSRTVSSEAKASSSVGKHLIPSDWMPTPKGDLPPRAKACAAQWTEASYLTEAEAFLLYWRSERKMKADWRDVWANRVIARHSAVMRDQKFGNAAPNNDRQELSAADYRERAEWYDRRNMRDDAARCRQKAAQLEQGLAA
jgi:hypothetical protein